MGVEKCERVYGVSGEVCWRVGKGCEERNGGGVGKCVRVWGSNTLPSTLLTSPPSPHSPRFFLHLPLLPPHSNTLSYIFSLTSFYIFPSSRHIPTHFSTIPTSPLTFSNCGEVTMRRSFCGEVNVAKISCGEDIMRQSYWQPSYDGN